MAEYNKEKYYWFKLKDDFFKRHDIKIIKSMPNGKDYVIFYLQLLCESLSHNGKLRFNEEVPYNEEMLSIITDTNIDVVRSAMKLFVQLKLVEVMDDQTIYMTKLQSMIGSTTIGAEKKMLQREKSTQLLGGGQKVDKCPLDIDIEKDKEIDIYKYIKEKECIEKDTTPFDTFISKYSINVDNYSSRITEMDFNLLDKAFSESNWLQENYVSLSRICKDYEKIVGGYYKDFVKPKEDKPDHLTDAEFLILKGFSKEWVMALSEEERAEKRKKWE